MSNLYNWGMNKEERDTIIKNIEKLGLYDMKKIKRQSADSLDMTAGILERKHNTKIRKEVLA